MGKVNMQNLEQRNILLSRIIPEGFPNKDNEPIILSERGKGFPVVVVTAAMHGNEDIGVYILNSIRTSQISKGTLRLIIANPNALFNNVRFICEDLNRIFPGEKDAKNRRGEKGERDLAAKLLNVVGDPDFLVDLHTASTETEPFVILTKKEKQRLEFGERTGIQKIVLIESKEGHSLVDFVRMGIGIELGLHDSVTAYNRGLQAVSNILVDLEMAKSLVQDKNVKHEYYELYGSILKLQEPFMQINPSIKSFLLVSRGEVVVKAEKGEIIAEEDFYPVFVGEKAYKDKICLKAKKISREEILKRQIL